MSQVSSHLKYVRHSEDLLYPGNIQLTDKEN